MERARVLVLQPGVGVEPPHTFRRDPTTFRWGAPSACCGGTAQASGLQHGCPHTSLVHKCEGPGRPR